MSERLDHFELIARGLRLHEREQYERALPLFARAVAHSPTCPNARYNLANVLFALDRDAEACQLLRMLVDASDDELRNGCDDLDESPRSIRLDALFLLFKSTLAATGSWQEAAPFLRRHLALRARGVRSLWSKRAIRAEAEQLRREHAPRARPFW